jgi:hypothetical protein
MGLAKGQNMLKQEISILAKTCKSSIPSMPNRRKSWVVRARTYWHFSLVAAVTLVPSKAGYMMVTLSLRVIS